MCRDGGGCAGLSSHVCTFLHPPTDAEIKHKHDEALQKEKNRAGALKAELDKMQRDKPKVEASLCVICLTEQRSNIAIPCGHQCVCGVCMPRVCLRCPLCRAGVEQWVKVFL